MHCHVDAISFVSHNVSGDGGVETYCQMNINHFRGTKFSSVFNVLIFSMISLRIPRTMDGEAIKKSIIVLYSYI